MKDGFLLIDKEVDWTSRDVCNKASHILNVKKVGHTGTLDPFATGLLLVALGKASKFIPYLENADKTYIAELTLGVKTNTGDLMGDVESEMPVPELTKESIQNVMNSFLGPQSQVPPMTSAISVNGQKLYKLAHKGLKIERQPRQVHIFDLKILSYDQNKILFTCKVSKGTYIRVLGEDIAEKLGTVGHLTALRRTNISNFSVTKAIKVLECSEDKIIPMEEIARDMMEIVYVDSTYIAKIKNGVILKRNEFSNNGSKMIYFISKLDGEPLAIYQLHEDEYRCARGLWA